MSDKRSEVQIEFAGEWFRVEETKPFVIGREGDLTIDDNQYLHRHFLQVGFKDGLWWLTNVGSRLSATISSGEGTVQSWLAPGAALPLVFSECVVVFTAGPTTYELTMVTSHAEFEFSPAARHAAGEETVMPLQLSDVQKLLVVALAEPMLRRDAAGVSELPTNSATAGRLGWSMTTFNRRLDALCDKLDQMGVQGMRAAPGKLATNRRARLVEYAVSSRLVSRADLALLDAEQ
ncbi:MAG TPA: hypothetical protein H9830_12890 [Candidatus Agrococcus pullicola]|uniref:Uncharacterized protein n=1 Tax=Candidatus Agrococcus pullicola TaxID=2838429 RepID=A0A9D2CAQ9_9MICO|nr:hypothetical protein [Candidatus Agrococcus pullicola]